MKLIKIMFLFFCVISFRAFGQVASKDTLSLSFLDAIEIGAKENISVNALKVEESATQNELSDAKNSVFPKLSASAGYQRFSKVTVYDGILGESFEITKPPNANAGNLGVELFFNLYSGKKQQNAIKATSLKNDLAFINTTEHIADIKLQVAQQYLDMVRLYHLKKITEEQIVRTQKRFNNINSLYKNGKVTRSDLLRAELMLSQVELSDDEAKNDYLISNRKLNVLLNMPESKVVVPSDTTALEKVDSTAIKNILEGNSTPYAIRKSEKLVNITDIQSKIIKAGNLPSVGLIGSYGLNYPNNIVFPPMDQTLRFGFIGAKVSYDISSLYHNRNKIKAADHRIEERKLEQKYLKENLYEQKQSLYIKYMEALNRINVTKKSIAQAAANYDIINKKYFNQLALLTDLLDADNLYQQSKYDYIKAQIYARTIYYRILYITGQL